MRKLIDAALIRDPMILGEYLDKDYQAEGFESRFGQVNASLGFHASVPETDSFLDVDCICVLD